jgi:type VI secretion system secreted protein Hcp
MIYLTFETKVAGESKSKGFEGQINIQSSSWGVGRGISSVGGGANRELSKPSFSEISLAKDTDLTSAELFNALVSGTSLGKATITWVSSGGTGKPNQVYQVLTLGDAMVSSFSQGSGGDRPTESFSLNFTDFKFKYIGFDGAKETGTVEKGYDMKTE